MGEENYHPPDRLVRPLYQSVGLYFSEMIFALLPSDPVSNRIKRRILILHGAQVGAGPKFGRGLWIDGHAKLMLGNEVFFNFGCMLQSTGGIRIGHRVLVGPGVTILSANHDIRKGVCVRKSQAILRPVIIEDDVWLAARCIITPGVTIGKGAIVAAGAVVTRNVPPEVVVAGVPAKILKAREE